MKTLKSLIIGSTAAVVAVAGAQAASAPSKYDTKYEPHIECPTGFWNTTGTDVCLRVSGFARLVVYGWNDDNAHKNYFGTSSSNPAANNLDQTDWYGQGRLRFDARRNTSDGLLRTYVEIQATDNDTNTGGAMNLRLAFIQYGNWVFGKGRFGFHPRQFHTEWF
jgi:hypothetical protein